MKKFYLIFFPTIILIAFLIITYVIAQENQGSVKPPISEETRTCIECHKHYSPGIVEDWQRSRHSTTTPETAKKKLESERRVSAQNFPANLGNVAVGCYECHGLNTKNHKDNIEHAGMSINVIVSPNDCKACHPAEVQQFSDSKKAYALDNLRKNPTYHNLTQNIVGLKGIEDEKYARFQASNTTEQETCYACHGTEVNVEWMKEIPTDLGDMTVPIFINWPNQGVGRINPDGSRGTCTACHPRHSFSIEIARKPHTCAQCHLEPDTPAWDVYKESKHGNIYSSKEREWNWNQVPWRLGNDFSAPTCSVCHNSLIVTSEGKTIAPRTHDFGSRLWKRIFGLIYSHPQPKKGDTSIINNQDGINLPTNFEGKLAQEYLLDEKEQSNRQVNMENICKSCHGVTWVDAHFKKMDKTILETDKMTLTATQIMQKAWENGYADSNNPFDESLEHKWMKQWLFYANSVRYASAMTGAPDYATFKHGWWDMTRNLQDMQFALSMKGNTKEQYPIFTKGSIGLDQGKEDILEEYGFGSIDLSGLTDEYKGYLGLKDDEKPILKNVDADLIIMEFMNVYCPSCQMQSPIFAQLYSVIEDDPDLKSRVKMLSIAAGNNQKEIDNFRNSRGIRYPMIADSKFLTYEKLVNSMRAPYTIMLRKDKDGNFLSVASHFGLIRSYESYLTELKAVMQYDAETIELKQKEQMAVAGTPSFRWSEEELGEKVKEVLTKASADENVTIILKDTLKIDGAMVYEGVSGEGIKHYAVVVGKESVCDICHAIQFIYVFDEKGNIVEFEPIHLTKYGNKMWSEADVEKMRKQIVGRSILQPVNFDPEVDAVTSATVTSAVIFKALSQGREIYQSIIK